MKKQRIIILIIFIILIFFVSLHSCVGWTKVDIPTATNLKGTIKISNKWEFITEDGIIKLINSKTKEVYAEQIFVGYKDKNHIISSTEEYEDKFYPEKTKGTFNENINLDITNNESFTFDKGYSNGVYQYIYNDQENEYIIMDIAIFYTKDFGDYYLSLLIYNCAINNRKIEKMINSYRFGGTIGY